MNRSARTTPKNARPDACHAGAAAHTTLRHALVQSAAARYRSAGRFAYHFARGKLAMDPLFMDVLRCGALSGAGRVLDLGCGQAVLAAWLLAAQSHFDAGQWPPALPAPPQLLALHGLELMSRDVQRARLALAGESLVHIEQADICQADFGVPDAITIFDVLHYFDGAAQLDVLRRARAALGPGGVLLMRVGDAAAGWRFALSRRVDQIVTWVRGHGWSQLYCRPVQDWVDLLQELGFEVRTTRTQGGPPFANTLLLARVTARANQTPERP